MKNIEGAIFDLDGTLIDSMGIWGKIDYDFLNKRNIKVPQDLKDKIETLTFEEGANFFKKNFKLKESQEEILKEWHNMVVKEYSHNIKLKNNVRDFLIKLKNKGVKLAIATSNTPELTKLVLENNKILDLFDSITTISEVNRNKTFPDIYLLCAEKLKLPAEKCAVFEDILPAIKSAKAAKMKTIGIYDDSSKDDENKIKEISDYYIYDYKELII
ncbi:HAD family hydrolase [Clostridium botulinum]|uniref:HAD family hydrolase n=1 Tax=Clostridium botulinum TaxID=1491 RepID=A0A846JDP8_CLOBO|nr:HAD family hydrolase [Clostridium botulinum]ACA54012.1 haloacid dehalogenase, IA family protein [Clostridium botulinum A3 str. Loch Maree]NFH65892.1 HAD family hydrolase [Clostridium botulinum]NFJ10187.1 HAD family hydrolase [Clostridium botulinum]NFK16451.1 HAD family hydrolase [Clostridium botulinum]NFM94360.1 HAD family hydrolase [Clostridium botulinum]